MSSGGSYLNSNVSLISKASIRYEGTLYSINPQEATITLSNVKSYGTEDRKVDKYLAPKDTLFEYIIFKANDIKELIVDEPLNDPAIVTAQMPNSTTTSGNAFAAFGESNLQSNGLQSDAQSTLNGLAGATGGSASNTNQATNAVGVSSSTGQTNERFRSHVSSPSSSQAHSPVSDLSSQHTKQKTDLDKVMSRGTGGGRNYGLNQQQSNGGGRPNNNSNYQQRRGWENNRMNNNQYNNQRPNNQRNYNNSNYNNNPMNRRPGGYQNNNYQTNSYNRGQQNGYRRWDDRISNHMNPHKNGLNPMNNHRGGGMLRNPRKFVPQSNKKFDATLKTEFDFEKANEQFQQMVDKLDDLNISVNGEKSEKSGSEDKEDAKNEIEKLDKVDEDGNFYDKTKSFFDKISCEAIERTKGNQKKFDWKQERKINAETFGLRITFRRSDGSFYRRPGGFNVNRNYNPNRRFNNNANPQQQRSAPRTNSSS